MVTVVIGDRLGKGQKVAAGIEKAGGRAVVVPGVAADMKLGDVMKAENADFGISFCGSGGAGAITNMATKPNTGCVRLTKALPPSMKVPPCWASALWIKKSWVSVWCRPGLKNTAAKYETAIRDAGNGAGQRRQ